MSMHRLLLVASLLFASVAPFAVAEFHDWAPTPPMGWNNWDCFATSMTEAQTKAQSEYMAAHLKPHGWQYIVVDIQWYEPAAKDHSYRPDAFLEMDDHGRLLPAPDRFPSSVHGASLYRVSPAR